MLLPSHEYNLPLPNTRGDKIRETTAWWPVRAMTLWQGKDHRWVSAEYEAHMSMRFLHSPTISPTGYLRSTRFPKINLTVEKCGRRISANWGTHYPWWDSVPTDTIWGLSPASALFLPGKQDLMWETDALRHVLKVTGLLKYHDPSKWGKATAWAGSQWGNRTRKFNTGPRWTLCHKPWNWHCGVDRGHVGLASCMEAILRCVLLIGDAS